MTMITILTLSILVASISPIHSIACFTCVDCGDPFNAQSSNVSTSPPTCSYCYKLTVYMAYAPQNYIVKECVQTCIESGRIFGGASLQVSCCQSESYCNQAMKSSTNFFVLFSLLFFFID